jgi:hypothetical protein
MFEPKWAEVSMKNCKAGGRGERGNRERVRCLFFQIRPTMSAVIMKKHQERKKQRVQFLSRDGFLYP